MTDIVPYNDRLSHLADTPASTRWVEMLAPAADLARQIANTGFVPKAMQDDPAAIAATILYGQELGIGPMQSLAKIDVVEGRPAPRAELARALILSAGHEFWVDELTNTKASVAGRRRGSDKVQRATWTLDDVKRAGLDGRQMYRKYPRQMLLARASAELARIAFADVLGGIAYFAEELDGDNEPASTPAAPAEVPAEPKKNTRRAKLVDPTPPPDTPIHDVALPPLPGEEEQVEAVELITDAQLRKLHALFNSVGVGDSRDDRLQVTSDLLGHPVSSSKDLTKAEASQVIDTLQKAENGELEVIYADKFVIRERQPQSQPPAYPPGEEPF